jgi:predicted regulator of Ras-like GTPase activity (Roadblock/LC7/MglB family)
MTTTPTPTGKIRGSLRDVTPKLQNFVGAVKVTTPSGKGGLLFDMGRPVAAYLTRGGVLHKGKASLELLEKEQLAEFEILRYDDEQFREAMIICDNRGLLLGEEKGRVAAGTPSRDRGMTRSEPGPVEQKKPKEENVLSAMMKRFAAPKVPEKMEPAQPATAEERLEVLLPPERKAEPRVPETVSPAPDMKPSTAPEKKEPATAPQETELSAIIKRLRESGKIEKRPALPGGGLEEIVPKAGVPEPSGEAKPSLVVPSPGEGQRPEKVPAGPSPPLAGISGAPEGQEPAGRVKVDLGKMMKRIKRLDITSIRKELQEGAEAGGTVPGSAAGPTPSPEEPVMPAAGPVRTPAPPAEARGKSDMDELKAFIQRLEILEEPESPPPPGKTLFAKLRAKPPAEEGPPSPARREIPVPVPVKERPLPEVPVVEEVKAVEKPPEERGAPRPAEPDRKAKITSLLRRSGLVKPLADEQPKEPITGFTAEVKVPEEKVEPPAPAEEAEIRVPRVPRKKVEITRVPKRPERPLREPPLLDESMIQRILKQPGVIAVSTFFEGFAVQSAGRADFEQVAANAEDLFRAGKKIAREIDIGPLNQIILETGKGKLIIAPHGDLNVCIFTKPDANLGLIRVAIKSMQVEQD